MIEINKNLKDLNTLMVSTIARYFARVQNDTELHTLLASDEWLGSKKHLILGGGSNVLFVDDYDGFVLKNEIKGIEVLGENNNELIVRVGAGENWHNFVMWSVENDYWGIENLIYIPGTVGAAPVQNIGAYGVEVKSSIQNIEYVDLEHGTIKNITNKDCEFSYRNSFFKQNPEKYFITYVIFKLQKNKKIISSYEPVARALEEKKMKNPSSYDIAEIIMEIRKSKVPDIKEIGTAGSFFKNPIISRKEFEKIQNKFSKIKYFELENNLIKIPAGWILDELKYKGYMNGHIGNYKNHALIVIHDGQGTGREIYEHVLDIIKKTKEVFDINLEPEVKIIK